MISRIRGLVREMRESHMLIEVNGFCYDVWFPPSLLPAMQERVSSTGELELVTFHYQQLEVGRGIPVLIGFLNEIERDFFVKFITVAGIGPKAALKALREPIPVIAQAIDDGNLTLLKSLPGIGEQRAREVVAKLQGKVGKYGLIKSRDEVAASSTEEPRTFEDEALSVLLQLEYKKPEANAMLKAARERNSKLKTAEDLLNEVYRQQRLATVA